MAKFSSISTKPFFRCLRGLRRWDVISRLCATRIASSRKELDRRVAHFARGGFSLSLCLSLSFYSHKDARFRVFLKRRDKKKRSTAFSLTRAWRMRDFFRFYPNGCSRTNVRRVTRRRVIRPFDAPRRHYESARAISSISLELSLLHARPTARYVHTYLYTYRTCTYIRLRSSPEDLVSPREETRPIMRVAEAALRAPRRFISRACRLARFAQLSVSFLSASLLFFDLRNDIILDSR